MIKVSLFASAIRSHIWESCFNSLEGTSCSFEVVFGGPCTKEEVAPFLKKYKFFKYIHTKNIKPSQIYEATRRRCSGEVIIWNADDAEMPDDVIGKAYRFYKDNCRRKDVLCMRTRENYGTWLECDNTQHHFFGNTPEAPKMAPIGMINREYFQELGGIDRRYIAGQWDNSLMIQVYNNGGKLHYFGDSVIELDHLHKHDPAFGISDKRPFGQAYNHDRKILEGSWGRRGQMIYKCPYHRYDNGFEPYEDKNLLTKSQSFNMPEIWED